jgi:hypothetical protein
MSCSKALVQRNNTKRFGKKKERNKRRKKRRRIFKLLQSRINVSARSKVSCSKVLDPDKIYIRNKRNNHKSQISLKKPVGKDKS